MIGVRSKFLLSTPETESLDGSAAYRPVLSLITVAKDMAVRGYNEAKLLAP